MAGRFPFKKIAKYPHMKPEDIAVWERFIDQNPNYFETVDYDFPVGAGAPTNPEHPENMQAMHTVLTQKKIDVVGYNSSGTYLVEVGPVADQRKLGQILAYEMLYKQTVSDSSPVYAMVLCGQIERELEPLFAAHAIILETA